MDGTIPDPDHPSEPDRTDPDAGPASEPTGAAEEAGEAEQEDPDAGPASEPGAAQGGPS